MLSFCQVIFNKKNKIGIFPYFTFFTSLGGNQSQALSVFHSSNSFNWLGLMEQSNSSCINAQEVKSTDSII